VSLAHKYDDKDDLLPDLSEQDRREAEALADQFTLEETKTVCLSVSTLNTLNWPVVQLMAGLHKQHARDPNFPIEVIKKIEEFLGTSLGLIANFLI
jgi:hypothetical protein